MSRIKCYIDSQWPLDSRIFQIILFSWMCILGIAAAVKDWWAGNSSGAYMYICLAAMGLLGVLVGFHMIHIFFRRLQSKSQGSSAPSSLSPET